MLTLEASRGGSESPQSRSKKTRKEGSLLWEASNMRFYTTVRDSGVMCKIHPAPTRSSSTRPTPSALANGVRRRMVAAVWSKWPRTYRTTRTSSSAPGSPRPPSTPTSPPAAMHGRCRSLPSASHGATATPQPAAAGKRRWTVAPTRDGMPRRACTIWRRWSASGEGSTLDYGVGT